MNAKPVCTKAETPFEHETCSRCGGGGEYSYCQSYGTKCFKCHGKGWTLTARGQVAAQHYTELMSVPASALTVGQTVRVKIYSFDGSSSANVWREVEKIEAIPVGTLLGKSSNSRDPVTGEPIWIENRSIPGMLNIDFGREGKEGIGHRNVEPGTLYRVAQSAEQKAAALAKALAYQATLTVKGKPRKR